MSDMIIALEDELKSLQESEKIVNANINHYQNEMKKLQDLLVNELNLKERLVGGLITTNKLIQIYQPTDQPTNKEPTD